MPFVIAIVLKIGGVTTVRSAPVLVATLETQKNRLIQGEGPALLVVDEYQMLSDPERGLNYELAMMAWFCGCVARPVPTPDGILSWDLIEREMRPLGPHAAPT